MIPFNENQFSFLLQTIYKLASCVQIPRVIGAFYHVWKWQCSTSKIGDAPLYNSCSLLIQVMTTGPLPAPSKGITGLPRITDMPWVINSFWLRLWSLVWFQVRSTSCHLTSSKSAWKSTPKCTWMCWRVWWSPGAIRWWWQTLGVAAGLGADPQVQRDPGLASEGVLRLCTFLYCLPSSPTWTRWTTSFGHTLWTSPTWPPTTPKPAWLLPFAELLPALVEKACSQFQICFEAEGGYIV